MNTNAQPDREKEIFEQAVELTSAEERHAFLKVACIGEPELLARVEALLRSHEDASQFLGDKPATPATIRLTVPDEEKLGTLIGRYKLLEKVGEGGFGAVYVAEQREPVKRRVALKVIKLGMDTKEVVARFEAERQALALMDHPNIAKVLDAGATESGRPYFVMELVRGIRITDYCDQNQFATIDRLKLFIQVCNAVQHAHQKGIIHRDIKPSNILVTLHDGVPVPKVIDFGIAKATQQELTDKTVYTQLQQFIGTPAYISPEQAEMSGLDIDTRADIYSLGVLLYELLTGQTPFDARELLKAGLDELRRTIREIEPLRPSTKLNTLQGQELTSTAKRHGTDAPKLTNLLRGDIDWIVMKCLEKDRTRRYETANGLAADLQRHLKNEPVVARPPSPAYRFHKFVRRNKRAALAAAIVAVALLAGVGISTYAFIRERHARMKQERAERERQTESVRADAVAGFMDNLLNTTVPTMVQQGNQRSVRELLEAADQLASSALSNAPAAELSLRYRMERLYISSRLLKFASAGRQGDRISELLPQVADERLPVSRIKLRIEVAQLRLWCGETERGLAELHRLSEEFRQRTPPVNEAVAGCAYAEAVWLFQSLKYAPALEKFSEAVQILPQNASPEFNCKLLTAYGEALNASRNWTNAESVLRRGLLPPAKLTPDLFHNHISLLRQLSDSLCAQLRFDDLEALLREQKGELSERGCPPQELWRFEALRAAIPARAGRTADALPKLFAVATNSNSGTLDYHDAALVALGSGEEEIHRQLCLSAVTRFASVAEQDNALNVATILLHYPRDKAVMHVAQELIQRVERAENYASIFAPRLRALLAYRLGNYAEALAAAEQSRAMKITDPVAIVQAKANADDHMPGFLMATIYAQLDRPDDARKEYAAALRKHGPVPTPERPRDLGARFGSWYNREAMRHEAEQVFKAKGISITEPGEVQ